MPRPRIPAVPALRRMKRLAVVPAVCLATIMVGAASAVAAESYPRPADGTYDLSGRGFGHGIGMSQWGARGAAEAGESAGAILRFYYPGTTYTSAGNPWMRVWLTADNDDTLTVVARSGIRMRAGSTTTTLPTAYQGKTISYWRIRRVSDTRYRLGFTAGGQHYWYGRYSVPGPVTLSRPGYTLLLVRPDGTRQELRGALRAVPDGAAPGIKTVSVVAMESYLRSVVPAEMPALWPAAALRVQSVAARTYALRARERAAASLYDLCDTQLCQVYAGKAVYDRYLRLLASGEHARTDTAITSTAGDVLRDSAGRAALTMFSAANGGWSVDGGIPYLRAVEDSWDGHVPNTAHVWTTTVPVSRIEQAYPSIGRLTSIEVRARDGNGVWGGRIESMRLVGGSGAVVVTGDAFRSAMRLRSTWWTVP